MTTNDEPKSRGRRASRSVSREEADLFRQAMKDAKKLEDADTAGPVEPPSPPDLRTVRPAPSNQPALPSGLPELSAGAAAGLDSRTMDRLKRGRLRPEAKLDLHGKTRDEAHRALADFLARSQGAGRRCVIVVTGKGRLSEGGGVIRNEVPHWLNLAPNRARILGFAQAQPRDGGAGALYVLLRRTRD